MVSEGLKSGLTLKNLRQKIDLYIYPHIISGVLLILISVQIISLQHEELPLEFHGLQGCLGGSFG